ncbi:Spermidine/putrescine import ATP-binding protein PotA [Paenibacillus plantiphilus]|uniref:Spermidine/putrescine import ATP-binding protein PotA n=1 Tax=Paenibacillus plantiphilus TaxID=2905650 RepID=A0ABN8GCI8_9BACL|nr:ABC transporter ATP-binding protein [Paenibacillus plantiphilus]CAH1205468.1 Spermidine/putrescine import ATP-binding protein PotA [Paenibacillus plantiphilus]
MNTNMILSISHLSKRYPPHLVINDLSCEIHDGEFISILGPSGGGKSTLLQLIAGLVTPDEGEIRIREKLVSSSETMIAPENRGVNMVFQNYALWPHMNVYDHIAFGLKRQKLPRAERDQRVQHLLQMLELQGLENRVPAELSGGQQQRVAIARALATAPKILLLDEPMSNLDGYLRLQMRSKLKALFGQLGTTVLYVTHDPEEALAMADRLIIMRDGRIEQMDTPQQCYLQPASPWVAGMLGAINSNNSLEAAQDIELINMGDQSMRGMIPIPEIHIVTGQRLELRSRPEDITIFEEEPTSIPPHYSMVRPLVLDSGFEGKHWRITLLVEPDIFFYGFHHTSLVSGTRVWAISDSSKLFIYPFTNP